MTPPIYITVTEPGLGRKTCPIANPVEADYYIRHSEGFNRGDYINAQIKDWNDAHPLTICETHDNKPLPVGEYSDCVEVWQFFDTDNKKWKDSTWQTTMSTFELYESAMKADPDPIDTRRIYRQLPPAEGEKGRHHYLKTDIGYVHVNMDPNADEDTIKAVQQMAELAYNMPPKATPSPTSTDGGKDDGETVEQAAERHCKGYPEQGKGLHINDFKKGAQWQSTRPSSKEQELREALEDFIKNCYIGCRPIELQRIKLKAKQALSPAPPKDK